MIYTLPFLCVYLGGKGTCLYEDFHVNLHSSALLIAANLNQPHCPSAVEKIHSQQSIHTHAESPAVKCNELLISCSSVDESQNNYAKL